MTILKMSLSASILIMVVIVIRALALHKLPKKAFLALWGIVLCRLLFPYSLPSQFSIYTLADRIGSGLIEQSGITTPNRVMLPMVITNTIIDQNVGTALPTTSPMMNLSPLMLIWITGCIACTLFFIVTHLRCWREYKTALPLQNDFVNKWQQEHPLKRSIQIRQSDKIAAPLTYGVWSPVILLPKTTDYTDECRLQYILVHEYAHIRRFDTLLKCLLAAALSIHWFNPLVWVMYALSNRDIELSCDETVIRTFGVTTKSAYALALIDLAEKKSRITPLCSNFSRNSMEERITAIMKIKKTSLVRITLAFTLIVGTTVLFATSAFAGSSNNDDTESIIDTTFDTDDSIALGRYDEKTGKNMISLDNGNTWMTEEANQDPEVEWWSYIEYKAWLEQEKISLQDMIGEEGWNQERIDETIDIYEDILAEIKNGMMVSKSVKINGVEEDIVICRFCYDSK